MVEIREYDGHAADFAAGRALWAELTRRHREIYGDPAIGGEDPGCGFEAYLADPARRSTWVAEEDGRVVGLAGLLVRGGEAEVEPVVVTAARRCRGIGTALLRRAIDEARRAGYRHLGIRPVARNVEAIALFVRCGFDVVGHVDLFQDLVPTAAPPWKPGLTLHGHRLRY